MAWRLEATRDEGAENGGISNAMADKIMIEIELGPNAISKLYDVLTWGSKYKEGGLLAGDLLRLPLDSGALKTFWPNDGGKKEAFNYDSWGPYPFSHSPKPTGIKPKVYQLISDFLSGASNRYALFETQDKRGVGAMKKSKQPFITRQPHASVYYYLSSLDHTPNKIDDAVRFARYYPFIGCLTSLPKDEPTIQPFAEVTESSMEKLASRTDIIIIDAYDGVGFWIWYKNP